ncbi:MAG: protease modulator HflC [Verrucomicrobia bacterium]|nr:MAG: protease modulator HflC [Verrucomicrobiota bacterium]
MKKNPLTLLIGALLLLVFLALQLCFQVRSTEVAVVTTFGKFSRAEDKPGLYFKLPLGIQKVQKFDQRLHSFERKYEQQVTRDQKSPILSVFVGWRIQDPRAFLESTAGVSSKGEEFLGNFVSDAKNSVIGRHDFSELISPDPAKVKFEEIEKEMAAAMNESARKVGLRVEFVGIKELGLPEALTAKVFERMRTEREKLVKKYIAEGTSEATRIRSEADLKRTELIAQAENDAQRILGGAEAEATKSYQILQQDPEFAVFLLSLRSLEGSLKERSTLILDPSTPPFSLLRGDQLGPIPGTRLSDHK